MKQTEFNQFVIEFIREQKEFNKIVIQRLDNIEHRINIVENDIQLIKSCPTIQKELKRL